MTQDTHTHTRRESRDTVTPRHETNTAIHCRNQSVTLDYYNKPHIQIHKSSSARSLLQLRASIKSAHRQTKYIHCVANYEIVHTQSVYLHKLGIL